MIKTFIDIFDKKYEAQNFWMGDNKSVSSLHKDPF